MSTNVANRLIIKKFVILLISKCVHYEKRSCDVLQSFTRELFSRVNNGPICVKMLNKNVWPPVIKKLV